eukprot:5301686-Prorocentrum_lima.AAC.1
METSAVAQHTPAAETVVPTQLQEVLGVPTLTEPDTDVVMLSAPAELGIAGSSPTLQDEEAGHTE